MSALCVCCRSVIANHPLNRARWLPLVALALSACSSADKKSDSDQRSSMESRLMKADTGKYLYEKEFNTAGAGNRGAMKNFGSKSFRTGEFGGQKDYKTSAFSQAGKMSRMGSQDSRFGNQTNRMSDSTFATKDSKLGSSLARQGTQEFRDAGATYKTGDFAPASKSLNDNKRIYLDTSGAEETPSANAYSEDQVKRLLGR